MSQLAAALGFAVALCLAGCGAVRVAPSATEWNAVPKQTGYVDAGGGVRLFYRVDGRSPRTIVVLHGGPGFTHDYLADDLAPLAASHALIHYDQRGAGRSTLVSDPPALDAQRFADDLEALRRHFGQERLTLLGHSWGAAVAALYALRYPERIERLIVVGGIPLRKDELVRSFQRIRTSGDAAWQAQLRERRDVALSAPGDAAACRAFYETWFVPFYGNRAAAGSSKGDFCAGTPESLANKAIHVDRYTLASLGDWDWRPALRAVRAPTLVIHGSADVIAVDSAREWVAALPDARLLLLEGIGHFPYLEAPGEFFAAVHTFANGHWPARATR